MAWGGLNINKYVNIYSLCESRRSVLRGGFALGVSLLFFLAMTVVRKSNTHWTIILEPEEIESNQVERICYLVLAGSVYGEIVKEVKFIVGTPSAGGAWSPSPRGVLPLWPRPWHCWSPALLPLASCRFALVHQDKYTPGLMVQPFPSPPPN